jgi:cytochrome c oxidase subunit 3
MLTSATNENLEATEMTIREGGGHSATLRTGVWLLLAVISMIFAALTSAVLVSQEAARDWQHIPLPRLLWWGALLLLGASVCVEVAKRVARRQPATVFRWLTEALLLQIGFLGGQLLAMWQIYVQGVHLSSSLSVSYFYVIVGAHFIFALGGTIVTAKLAMRSRAAPKPAWIASFDALSYYWHFILALWIYVVIIMSVLL